MNTKQKTNWWIDVVLFSGFITTFFLDLTGVGTHQWIGILSGSLAAYHLFIHRVWVGAVSRRFFTRTSGQARIYFALDVLLLLGFALIVVTGLGISTWLNLSLSNFTTWLNIHITISIAALVILLLKLTLHWRWLARAVRSIWPKPVVPSTPNTAAPARVSLGRMGRREFLQVMGVVGAASLVAMVSASKSLGGTATSTEESSAAGNMVTQTTTNTVTTFSQSSTSSSNDCTISCQKGCSYPGHCHRYVDTNNNSRCDWGECT